MHDTLMPVQTAQCLISDGRVPENAQPVEFIEMETSEFNYIGTPEHPHSLANIISMMMSASRCCILPLSDLRNRD